MALTEKILNKITEILKLIGIGILVGVVGGILGFVFHISLEYVSTLRENNEYLLCFLPLGGIFIAFMYNSFAYKGNIDIKRVFQSARENKEIPVVMMPLIFVGTIITHLFGGSAGREGAALQLGGSLGYNIAKKFKTDDEVTKLMVTAGMSSVFSALFGVPLAAAVFSLEVIRKKKFVCKGLILGLVSSVVAFILVKFFNVSPVRFNLTEVPKFQVDIILKTSLLALLLAGVCIVFAITSNNAKILMKKHIQNSYIRVVTGGLIIVLLTVVLRTTDYNGAGMDVINNAISGQAKSTAFIFKIIFTAITMASGFKGGEIVPTFFIGATFGCSASLVLGIDAGFAAAIGFVCMFAGMTKCPLSSILLAIEVFGGCGVPLFIIAIIITFIFSGHFGLYDDSCRTKKICSVKKHDFVL